jgi:hypothetical protein
MKALTPSVAYASAGSEQKIHEPLGFEHDGVDVSLDENSAQEVADRLDEDKPSDQGQIAIAFQKRTGHPLDLHGRCHGMGLTSVDDDALYRAISAEDGPRDFTARR